jgi:protein SCO1/2
MNNLCKSSIAALAALFLVVPLPTLACEKHAQHASLASDSAPRPELPGNSIYHLSSKWTNQNSDTRKFSEFAGRPRLIAMVFTRCQTACPVLVKNIQEIDTALPVDLFSFDAERETVQSMQEFIKKYKLDDSRWTIHTSAAGGIAELAATLGVQYKKLASGDFIHANVIFLINEKGEVVAKSEGLGQSDPAFLKAVKTMNAGG